MGQFSAHNENESFYFNYIFNVKKLIFADGQSEDLSDFHFAEKDFYLVPQDGYVRFCEKLRLLRG